MESKSSSTIRFMGLAQNALNKNQERLASGSRLNRASDDAAGLAIVAALDAVVAELGVANRNIGDGMSIAEVADGAMSQIGGMMQRMAELSTQAANGVYSDEQRASMNAEYQQLAQEVERVQATTTFNGVQVLGGSSTTIQVGPNSSPDSQIQVPTGSISAVSSSLSAQDISTQAGAQAALDTVNTQISNLSSLRGDLGASMRRLDEAAENNSSAALALEASAARIRDVDVADEAAQSVANNIKLNSAAAMQAHSNMNQKIVLDLLK